MWPRITSTAALGLVLGCASAPPAIQLDAAPSEVAALAGEWHGEYGSSSSGRHGSVLFVLRPGSDSAYGEVLMVPAGYAVPRNAAEAAEQIRRPVPQVLGVAFVHIEHGTFAGRLEPYRDPGCGCPLTTIFSGRLVEPDVIRGTFTTTGPPGHATHTGEWSVRRVRR
jgi:hypothetical protein